MQAKLPGDAVGSLQRAIAIATEFEQRAKKRKSQEAWMSRRGVAECRLATALELALKMELRVAFKFPKAPKEIAKQDLRKQAIATWRDCQRLSGWHDDITPEEEALRDSADRRIKMLDQKKQL